MAEENEPSLNGDNMQTDSPQVRKARHAVETALKNGSLKKPTVCDKCGEENPLSSHHYKGYEDENLTTVKWLCRDCHNAADAKMKNKTKKGDSSWEHLAIIRSREEFIGGSFETEYGVEKGVDRVTGILSDTNAREIQRIEFSPYQFSEKQAKDWMKLQDLSFIKFLPAKDAPKMDQASRLDYFDFSDSLTEKLEKTPEGYLSGRAIITNVGVFPYLLPGGVVRRELRLPSEVFAQDSLATLKRKPVTLSHPAEQVNSSNVQSLQVGILGDDIRDDYYHVSAPITIMDKDAVEAVRIGKRALSAGYVCDLEESAGVWCGVPYDAIQKNIRYNHVALVDRGRAGDAAQLKLDSASEFGVRVQSTKSSEGNNMLKKITLDGVEYDAEAKVIESLHSSVQKIDSLTKDLDGIRKDLDQAKKDKSAIEAERDTLKDQIEKIKKDSAVKPEEIEKAVQARLVLLQAASRVEVKADGLSDLEIKKAVVLKVFPAAKEKLEKADEAYITARFDGAIEDLDSRQAVNSQNAQAASSASSPAPQPIRADEARQKMIDGMCKAHLTTPKE